MDRPHVFKSSDCVLPTVDLTTYMVDDKVVHEESLETIRARIQTNQIHKEETTMAFKPTDDFVNYITNPDNVWNPERYLENRRVNGIHERCEYNFKYAYTLGNAYMTGQLGIDGMKVEVYYQYLQGFQIYFRLDGELIKQESFPPHAVEEAKELLAFFATNGN